jgi:MFS family permease
MPSSDDLPTPGSLVLLDEYDGSPSTIRLSPMPSNDINDPLRWSWKRKQLAHLCLVIYTLCTGSACTLVYSILVPIEKDTGIPLSTLNAGTGYFFFLLGWGGMVTQPLALMFGKRGIYLISMVGSIACLAWNAYVSSEGEWIANKIIQGLFISPIEMLVETSIGDIFYAHERGFYIGIYALVLFASNYFAPLVAGVSIGKSIRVLRNVLIDINLFPPPSLCIKIKAINLYFSWVSLFKV